MLLQGTPGLLILGLPRGGIPVAYEIARALKAPLDVFVVRKLGVPGQEELAMGAIAGEDEVILDQALIEDLGIAAEAIARTLARERAELQRRESNYRRGQRPGRWLEGRSVVLVDDGLATGASMRVAVAGAARLGAERIIVAVPVASPNAERMFEGEVDEFFCLDQPEWFESVGQWYDDFHQVTDDEVRDLVAAAEADKRSENRD